MTHDALRDAEQWHVKPLTEQLDNKRRTFDMSDHQALLPQQPTVIATNVVDLAPIVAWWRDTEQRLRDQLFVEQSAARSAREALAASEARLKAAEGERERIRGDAYDERRGWQNRALNAENDLDAARDERDSAVAELERIKATMGSASTVPPALVAGSTAAVIEAYRLLRGHEPHYDGKREWVDSADAYKSSGNNHLDEAGCFLLYWLDENAPGGRP